MNIFRAFYKIVLDALFPLSKAEEEALSLTPQEALETLQPAPGYEGLAVELPDARSIFAYKDERVEKLVWSIKYKKSAQAVEIGGYALWKSLLTTMGYERGVPLGRASRSGDRALFSLAFAQSEMSQENSLSTPCVVVPMPVTTKRRRERGYNQCELLLDEVERLSKAAMKLNTVEMKCVTAVNSSCPRFIFEKNLLLRTRHSSRQTLKGRRNRVESAKGIFSVDGEVAEQLKNYPVILIDDVITTGSTMHEAIEMLKKAGFMDVKAISLAH